MRLEAAQGSEAIDSLDRCMIALHLAEEIKAHRTGF
jgi:hypothetical protein